MTDVCFENPWPYAGLCGSGYYGGLWPRVPVEIQQGDDRASVPVDGQPQTRTQRDFWRPLGFGVVAPVPGIPMPPPGDYPIWRAMDADPALTLSRAVITAPIREAGKSYEAREGTPDEWVKLVQEAIDPLWDEWLREALDALAMGWKPFECVYDRRNGGTVIADLVPLAQELSAIVTRDGRFAGIRNYRGPDNKQIDLLGPSALVVTCDAKNRDGYGRPWHENARLSWWLKLHVLADLVRLNRKASGIQGSVYYPPAADEAENHTNEKIAQDLLKRKMAGDGAVFPNAGGMLNPDLAADFRNIAGMAEASLWQFKLDDHGNNGPQAAALIDQLRYYNADLSRAWHVPERSSQEAVTAGSRADSETHADIAKSMSQLAFNDAVGALNRGPVDTMLVQNYGEQARGAVTIKAGALRDVYAAGDWILIEAVLAVPDLMFAVAEQIDLDSIFTRRGIPKTAGVITLKDAIAQAKAAKQAAAAAVAATAQGPQVPDVATTGKANGSLAMARGVEWIGRFLDGAYGEDGDGNHAVYATPRLLELSTSGGEWRTINGVHVLIKGGMIVDGPSHLIGKSAGGDDSEGEKKKSAAPRLTDAERGAIEDYSGDKFQEINGQLRNGSINHANKKTVEAIDSAIEKLPKQQGVLHRSFTVPADQFDAAVKKYRKGEVVADDAYMSASTTPRRFTQQKNMVVFKMRNTDGVDVSGASLNPGEKEVLIPRGKRMRVLDTKIGTGGELMVLMEGA